MDGKQIYNLLVKINSGCRRLLSLLIEYREETVMVNNILIDVKTFSSELGFHKAGFTKYNTNLFKTFDIIEESLVNLADIVEEEDKGDIKVILGKVQELKEACQEIFERDVHKEKKKKIEDELRGKKTEGFWERLVWRLKRKRGGELVEA